MIVYLKILLFFVIRMDNRSPTVYVMNLANELRSPAAVEDALRAIVSPVAKVVKVVALTRSQRSRGKAWVTLETVADAERVVASCDGNMVAGRRVKIEMAKATSRLDVGKRDREEAAEDTRTTTCVRLGGMEDFSDPGLGKLLAATKGFASLKDRVASYKTAREAAEAATLLHGVMMGTSALTASLMD